MQHHFTPPPGYRTFFPEIEGVRGILSLIVLFAHIFDSLTARHPLVWAWGCMEVFFCISGFVITRNFFVRYQGRISVGYFINRALRIWPLYYFALAFAAVTTLGIGWRLTNGAVTDLASPSGPGIYLPLLFLQHVEKYGSANFDALSLSLFDHSWSVALEEHFYFVLAPLLFVLFRARTAGFILAIGVILAGLTVLCRYFGFSPLILIGRMEGFVLGIVLAFLDLRSHAGHGLAFTLHRPIFYRSTLIFSLVSLIPFLAETAGWSGELHAAYRTFLRPFLNPNFGFALFAFAVLGLIATNGSGGAIWRLLRTNTLQQLGRVSYSTYLLHVPIVYSVCPSLLRAFGLDLQWSVLVSPLIVIPFSFITYYGIERPFLRLKVYGDAGKELRERRFVVSTPST